MLVRDDQLELSVTDSGTGITAAALPDIFQPFVQDSHAVAFSGAGKGSEFIVTLPRAKH